MLDTIIRFFQSGGPFMYPILIVFALGAAIAVERWMYLTLAGASNRALWKKIVPFLKAPISVSFGYFWISIRHP